MTLEMPVFLGADFSTMDLVKMLEQENLCIRVLHVYPDSTARHAFYHLCKKLGTIRFVEAFLGEEEDAEWSFNLFELPSAVFLFLLPKDEQFAQIALEQLDSYMTGSVEDYGVFDIYNHRKSSSKVEVTTFVNGEWWLSTLV